MSPDSRAAKRLIPWLLLALCATITGCSTARQARRAPAAAPNESTRVSLPPYVIEPPDTLQIDAVNLIPKPPYRVEPLDVLAIQVVDRATREPPLPKEPVSGLYTVTTDGTVDLGFSYKAVKLVGLTLEEARRALDSHFGKRFKGPFDVTVELAQSRAMQQIRGEHLVRPDGTVGLGTYGEVHVDGLTLAEARQAIEAHLGQFLLNPQISIDVIGYNSKVYYVVADLAGNGAQVYRLPITGKETVLDAIAQVNGLSPVSSKHNIWVARPNHCRTKKHECSKLPVDWDGITQCGRTESNYQILPGDRVYVQGSRLVRADTWLARAIAPIERVLGVALLGASTVQTFENNNNGNNGGFFP
jgi:polysaccharide biosynthesis/export protein